MLVRAAQLWKADSLMLVTPLPIVTPVRLVQFAKARLPMLVTLSGMMMLVRAAQPWKAEASINETSAPSNIVERSIAPEA